MGLVRRVLTSFLEDEAGDAQMFQKADGSFWTRAADGTETQVGSGGSLPIQSGMGSPVGSVTPTAIGYLYLDLAVGATYQAVGATNGDWVLIGGRSAGFATGDEPGIGEISSGRPGIVGPGGSGAFITDTLAQAGSGNGLFWSTTGVDGAQSLQVSTGAGGAFFGTIQDANGRMAMPAGAGFFGHAAPAAQPATPVTLADVIAILRGCGLAA